MCEITFHIYMYIRFDREKCMCEIENDFWSRVCVNAHLLGTGQCGYLMAVEKDLIWKACYIFFFFKRVKSLNFVIFKCLETHQYDEYLYNSHLDLIAYKRVLQNFIWKRVYVVIAKRAK